MRGSVVYTDCDLDGLQIMKAEFAAADVAFDVLQTTEAGVIAERAREADVLLVHAAPITRDVILALSRCRAIIRSGVGVDNVDIPAATERRIYVANMPDYAVEEMSVHTLALILALVRKLPAMHQMVRSGRYGVAKAVGPIARFSRLTLGLVGFGRIARAVAHRAAGFGLQLLAYDPFVDAGEILEAGVQPVGLEDLLGRADIVSLHCPLTPETRHRIGPRELALMKPTGYLINTARGGLVDTDALTAALHEGRIAGAGLDVHEYEPAPLPPDHPLQRMANVIMTPHGAYYSVEALADMLRKVTREALRVLEGEPPQYLINRELLTPGRAFSG
jgi:D-3-phosphoglycerate dehydrogenase